jgi:hypothetical protein
MHVVPEPYHICLLDRCVRCCFGLHLLLHSSWRGHVMPQRAPCASQSAIDLFLFSFLASPPHFSIQLVCSACTCLHFTLTFAVTSYSVLLHTHACCQPPLTALLFLSCDTPTATERLRMVVVDKVGLRPTHIWWPLPCNLPCCAAILRQRRLR